MRVVENRRQALAAGIGGGSSSTKTRLSSDDGGIVSGGPSRLGRLGIHAQNLRIMN